jgi:thiol-disulfide isomerase/thioredoxin
MKIRYNKKVMFAYILVTLIGFCFTGCHSKANNKNVSQTEVQTDIAPLPEDFGNEVVFKDKNGKTISLSSLKGKVVFINFWATWCPPCIQEMPSIDKLKQSFYGKEDIIFLMVDVDNNIEKSTAFMEKKKYDLPVYVPASNIPSDYLGSAIPTTVILDKNGNMVTRIKGGRDYTNPEIIKVLNELIGSN